MIEVCIVNLLRPNDAYMPVTVLALSNTNSAPRHYLNQCRFIVNWALDNTSRWNWEKMYWFSVKKIHLKCRPFCLSQCVGVVIIISWKLSRHIRRIISVFWKHVSKRVFVDFDTRNILLNISNTHYSTLGPILPWCVTRDVLRTRPS